MTKLLTIILLKFQKLFRIFPDKRRIMNKNNLKLNSPSQKKKYV